jgi:WD40 repeat protein
MKRPCPPPEALRRLLDGELGVAEEAALSRHVQACAACQGRLERMVADGSTPALRAAPRQTAADGAADAVIARLKQRDPWGDGGALPSVPGYEVLEELGRGGMGVVYKARRLDLQRTVALKMILTGAGERDVARFRTEAAAVARLHHPNIVQVYDVGAAGSRPYLVLEFVAGGSLKRRLAGAPLPAIEAARLLETAARAVDAAHLQGVLHRDLKPANVLLAEGTGNREQGTADETSLLFPVPCSLFPKIADFGLAKLCGGEEVTRTGEVVGTPSYMAPEQARAGAEVGPEADVYALGAILYECLTGRPPFTAETPVDTLFQVLHVEPVSVTRLQPKAPRDLAVIAHKCLEKRPAGRYASAAALADDLRRFLDRQPIRARPAGAAERAWKWARRRPAVAGLAAAVAAVALAGLAGVLGEWARADANARQAVKKADDEAAARRDADEQRRRAERLSAGLALDQGVRLCEEGKTGPGLLWMARALELTPDDDDLAFAARANLADWREHFCPVHPGPGQGTIVTSVAFSPDGRAVLTGDWGNTDGRPGPAHARLWDAAAWGRGEPAPSVTVEHERPIWSVAIRPDGRAFATASEDGTARLWDAETGQPLGEPMRYAGPVYAVAFSPDGRTVATAGLDVDPAAGGTAGGVVRFWDAADGKKSDVPESAFPATVVRALAWSPDGRSLAVGSYLPGNQILLGTTLPPTLAATASIGGVVRVVDASTGKARDHSLLHADEARAVAYSPDGKALATACRDGLVRFWDAQTLQRLPVQMPHPYPVQSLAFSRDGAVLVTGCGAIYRPRVGPGEVRVWDAATGQLLLQPPPPRTGWDADIVYGVALSPDGRTVAAASEDGRAWLWDLARGATPAAARRFDAEVDGLRFSPDGRTFLTTNRRQSRPPAEGDRPSQVRLFRADTAEPTGVELTLPWAVGAEFSPDGRRVLTCPVDARGGRPTLLWDAGDGRPVGLPAEAVGAARAAFTPDGKELLTADADGKVQRWDATTFAPAGDPLDHGAPVLVLGVSPDGARLFTAGADGRVRLWSFPDGRPVGGPLTDEAGPGWPKAWFSADGRVLLAAWERGGVGDSTLRLWAAADGRPLGAPQSFPGSVEVAALDPQGKSFLTTVLDPLGAAVSARLWDGSTNRPLGPEAAFRVSGGAAFHPSGRFLALGGAEADARLWSPAVNKPIGPPLPHPGPVGVAFSPDGALLVTHSPQDQMIRLWKIPEPLAGAPRQVRLRIEALTGQELDEAGGVRDLAPPEREDRRRLAGG